MARLGSEITSCDLRGTPLPAAGVRAGVFACSVLATSVGLASELPPCLELPPEASPQSVIMPLQPSAAALLARLVYAETRSTGFADDPRVAWGIAWGVMNRVRLSERSMSAQRQYGRGLAGVIFQPQQFNPAVSRRSPFARDFLCPRDLARWQRATEAADGAVRGVDNPFVETPWERRHGLALVVNFYYPQSPQARGPLAPWEGASGLRFIGTPTSTALPPPERVRFYRLTHPPADLD